MGIVMSVLSPHPPLIIPEVGGRQIARVRDTKEALQEMARRVACREPDLVVAISPHAPRIRGSFLVRGDEAIEGDFGQFGAADVRLRAEIDQKASKALVEEAKRHGVPATLTGKAGGIGRRAPLDHGVLVPLYYLRRAGVETPLAVISVAAVGRETAVRMGACINRALTGEGKEGVFVASVDLSHRLTADAPAGYDPKGKEFDEALMRALAEGDFKGLTELSQDLVGRAGECGYYPVLSLVGTLCSSPGDLNVEDIKAETEVLNYEGPFGVGYGVVVVEPRER